MLLRDGTVIPSYLGVTNTAAFPEPPDAFGNMAFRQGEVKEIIYPSDKRSVSKKFVEYRVVVQYLDERGAGMTTEYPNCYLANLFGGIADRFVYTLRPKGKEADTEDGLGQGSKVTLLCLNGETNNAVIVGGIRDSQEDENDPEEQGHHMVWEFNGIHFEVNNDGELSLTFKGATKADGTPTDSVDQQATGATITLVKNGDIILKHDDQEVRIDHKDQNLIGNAANEVDLTGKKNFNINTDGTTTITAAHTKIGGSDAQDALVMGTTYRKAETQLNNSLSSSFAQMAANLTAMAAAVVATSASLQAVAVAHKTPVVGPVIGSAALQLSASAISSMTSMIQSMASAMTSAVQAIASFEGQAPTYLSKKNATD